MSGLDLLLQKRTNLKHSSVRTQIDLLLEIVIFFESLSIGQIN